MPTSYVIDPVRRLIINTGNGVLTHADCLEHHARLRADPHFDPTYSQLDDFSGVEKFELSQEEIADLARNPIFSQCAQRLFVTPTDLSFGLSRMFAMLREIAGERGIIIARSRAEAIEYLRREPKSPAEPGTGT